MSNLKRSRTSTVVGFVISLALVVAAGWVLLNRQYVSDQIQVWRYTPSATVATINERVGFTQEGTFTFYATSPDVLGQDAFNKKCPRYEAGSPILGCYTSDDRIYVFDVQNSQLDGIQEVTAAHEMLHAAWHRMSTAEKETLGTQLNEAYKAMNDEALTKRMSYYERTEPGELANELHSILGTEAASLPAALESHYKQFFNDRQHIVALHNQYSKTFEALYGRANEIRPKLTALSDTITKEVEAYRSQEESLSRDITAFNSRAASGDFTSRAQFNAERAALIDRSSSLDTQRQSINDAINTYNALTAEYNDIAQKIDGLNASIDSYKSLEKGPSI